MNLIGHYACALPHGPAFRLGSVLPDLLGLFSRKPRATTFAKFWEGRAGAPAGMEELLAGIRFHHHVDAHFHGAPLFREHATGLRLRLQEAHGGPGLKRFFAAHVLIELYYDHLLLGDNPDLSPGFYALLDGREGELLGTFVTSHPDVDGSAFKAFMARILEGGLIEGYRSMEGVLWRLNRVLLRLGQREMTEPEQDAAVSYLVEHGTALGKGLSRFVAAMQNGQAGADSHNSPGGAMMGRSAEPAEEGAPAVQTSQSR